MKKNKILIMFMFLVACFGRAESGFNFSDKSSKININSNTQFIVNKPIASFDGTLSIVDHNQNSVVGSNQITFQGGLLGGGSATSLFSGIYDPTGNLGADTITLQGTVNNPHRLSSELGEISQKIAIQGGYNTIEGRPFFTHPISLDGSPTTMLTFGIQNKLNQNIELNSGILQLSDDLSLANQASITGSGTIRLNRYV